MKPVHVLFKMSVVAVFLTILSSESICMAQKSSGNTTQRLAIQKERLNDIDEVATVEKTRIEEGFASQMEELYHEARLDAAKLRSSIQLVWVQYQYENDHAPYANAYFIRPYTANYGTFGLNNDLSNRYFLNKAQEFLLSDDAFELVKTIVQTDVQNAAITQDSRVWNAAYKVFLVMEELQLEKQRIANQKVAALNLLEDWQQNAKINVSVTLRDIEQIKANANKNVVSAIIYDSQKPSAMVDGEIVSAGSTINGVAIAKINKDSVEFNKKGKTWVTRLE